MKSSVTADSSDVEPSAVGSGDGVGVMVASVVITLAGMAWFVSYDWPSGREVGVGDFLAFYLREILGLLFILFVLAVVAIQKARKYFSARVRRKNHASDL